MAFQENIFGLLELVKVVIAINSLISTVLVQNTLDHYLRRLLVITSTVNQGIPVLVVTQLTTPLIHYGMVEAAPVRTVVVHSPTSRGSTDSYL